MYNLGPIPISLGDHNEGTIDQVHFDNSHTTNEVRKSQGNNRLYANARAGYFIISLFDDSKHILIIVLIFIQEILDPGTVFTSQQTDFERNIKGSHICSSAGKVHETQRETIWFRRSNLASQRHA